MVIDQLNFAIHLNVDKSTAEELYDEIEGHLALCFENIIQQQGHGLDLYSKIEQIITPNSLTGFLSEKLENDQLKVTKIQIITVPFTLSKKAYVTIFVPNLWAIQYGKTLDNRLDDAIKYFKSESKEDEAAEKKINLFNGLPVDPLIGSVYYDQLTHNMKQWNGIKWHAI